jgi:hypothetical protein
MTIRRISLFAFAVTSGAIAFGLFWSVEVHARSTGGGPYCGSSTANATMCYGGKTTVYNVPPATQSQYLNNGQATCNACPTTAN